MFTCQGQLLTPADLQLVPDKQDVESARHASHGPRIIFGSSQFPGNPQRIDDINGVPGFGHDLFSIIPKSVINFPVSQLLSTLNDDLESAGARSTEGHQIVLTAYTPTLLQEDTKPTNAFREQPSTPSYADNAHAPELATTTEAEPSLDELRQLLQTALEQLEKPADGSEPADFEAIKQGLAALQRAVADKTEREQFQKRIDSATDDLAKLNADLAAPSMPPTVDAELTIEDLQAEADKNQTNIESVAKRLKDVSNVQDNWLNELNRLNALLEETKEKIDVAERKRSELDRSNPLRHQLSTAQILALRELYAKLQKEVEWHRRRQPLLAPRLIWLRREQELLSRRKTLIDDRLKTARAKQADDDVAKAKEFELPTFPQLRSVAEKNIELTQRRQQVEAENQPIRELISYYTELLDRVTREYNEAQNQIVGHGRSQALGLMLRQQIAQLNAYDHRLQNELASDRVNELARELSNLVKLRNSHDLIRGEILIASVNHPNAAQLIEDGNMLLNAQVEYIEKLKDNFTDLNQELTRLDSTQRRLSKISSEFRFFIEKNILWIRSAERISYRDVEESRLALIELTDRNQWMLKGVFVWERFRQAPWMIIGVLASLTFLFLIRGMLIQRWKSANSRTGLLRILPVIRSALLTMVLAAIWPGVLAAIAWLIYSPTESGTVAASLASALRVLAPLLFLTYLLKWIAAEDGLGVTHLQWQHEFAGALHAWSHRVIMIVLPYLGIVLVVDGFKHGQWSSSLGRLAFFLAMAGMFYAMAAFSRKICRYLAHEKGAVSSFFYQWRGIWVILLVATPIALIISSAMGWHYSAAKLGNRLLIMQLISLVVISASCFLYRIACIGQQLVVERRRWIKLRAQQKNADEADGIPVDDDFDVDRVLKQVAGLMKGISAVAILMIGWSLFADLMPAAKFLDEIQLGSIEVEVTDQTIGEDNLVRTSTRKTNQPITLADGLICIVILIITFILSSNIPGVLEVSVLNRLPIDRGGRYAVSVICRYLVALVGLVIASRQVGLAWSNVQWLVAAMSVGLGFGLQEIFGNLVSGIIILLERPVRVGDYVTVNGQSGTITRIQLRATTIFDVERREIVIPNKKFITDDVINWTLTDPVNRVSIPIGVAYGTDIDMVCAVLREVANRHAVVLKDPEPSAVLVNFGASTLDFELRFHIPSREVFSVVRHELLLEIAREFNRLNIDIAFPQQDIHIRSINGLIPIGLTRQHKNEASLETRQDDQRAA
ncbi:MAG TPA: mechanosensitive ion channel [Pirellulaceae bacterium]|nr:mechanosensitive ion channel [Pirellulaceae bacterium]HMO92795.1 mechanosensitive ion channel [Pirellulaceae bacterium]HMP69377.1 mechanosensitive ion channel [Pirellulaceae bacterium]